jgi:hypothetical protein
MSCSELRDPRVVDAEQDLRQLDMLHPGDVVVGHIAELPKTSLVVTSGSPS